MGHKMNKDNFRRWKKIKTALFSVQPPSSSDFFVNRVMVRIDEASAPAARPRVQRVPVRIFAPLTAVAAILLLTVVPSGPAADWMVGSDGLSRWVLSNDAPQNDEVLEFVLGQS